MFFFIRRVSGKRILRETDPTIIYLDFRLSNRGTSRYSCCNIVHRGRGEGGVLTIYIIFLIARGSAPREKFSGLAVSRIT